MPNPVAVADCLSASFEYRDRGHHLGIEASDTYCRLCIAHFRCSRSVRIALDSDTDDQNMMGSSMSSPFHTEDDAVVDCLPEGPD